MEINGQLITRFLTGVSNKLTKYSKFVQSTKIKIKVDNLKQFNSANAGNKKQKLAIIILAIVIALLVGFSVYMNFNYKKSVAEIEEITQEKETLTFQYQNLIDDYESIETSNDTLSSQLSAEKQRIVELISKLRTTKAANKYEIHKYKKELKTLRNVMKGFIHQLDSLNTLNIQLTEENQEIKQQIYSANRENKKLNEQYETASSKVAMASVIRAINMSIQTFNHKGKVTEKAKKVKRFGIDFMLDENVIAATGIKSLYIRITDPNDHVLINDEQPMFNFEGEQIAYSALREIEYDGQTTSATVFFKHESDELLLAGSYKVDIFCEGHMIGSTISKLK